MSDININGARRRSSRKRESLSVFLTGAEDVKAEPEQQQQPEGQQGVVAKIRPITPQEKISFKYGEKMKWVQQCPFCQRWVGDLVEHVKNTHKRENFRQIKTRCPQPECGKMVVDIKNHITRVHEGVKNYQCEHCPARFASNYHVKKHVESIHTENERVKCGECNDSFKVSSLEGHVKRVHRGVKNEFPCPEENCGKVFGSNADRDRHVLSLHKKWKTQCPECGKKVGVESLLSHIKVVHRGVYPFPCTRCERGFQNQKDLKTHTIVKHHGTFLYCKATSSEGVECKQVLFSESSMLKHVEKHHLVEGLETVPCPECSAVILPFYLANHIHTAHTNILGVECVVEGCTDQFSGDDDLKHHLDTDHSSLCLEWCDKCSKPTVNLSLHSQVMHDDDEEPDFKPLFGVCLSQACSWKECSFMGHSSSHLANHVYSKHMRKTNMYCQECGMRTTNMPEHNRVHHTKVKTIVCEVCKKFFLKKAHLTQHMKKHGLRQKETCAECGVEVMNIRQHIRCVHEKDLPFKCNMGCSSRFSSKYSLKKHMESVHEGMRVECPKCFKMVVSLRNHIKIVHDKIRDHVCPLCQKTFQTRTHLRNHVTKVHLGLKDECPICGKHVQDLKNHHNFVHNKVANFSCDQCDRKCRTSTALKLHVSSVHLGEKVECPVCGEKICKAYLNNHIRRQHQAREKFECELCGKPFTGRSCLAKHIKRVHMQVKEICTVCGLETKDLYRHNRYTDCGKKGYVVRSRKGKQKMKIESSRRISRSLSRLASVSSDVEIKETTTGQDLEEDTEVETENNSSTATSPSSLLSRASVAESGMFSPVSITDLRVGSPEDDFFIVSESGERLEEI